MCLDLKYFAKKEIATEDIVVYKHLNRVYKLTEPYNTSETIFKTPFMDKTVELGKTYESKLKTEFQYPLKRVCKIGLHSFKYKSMRLECWGDLICKCIIPKGSSYYIGKFWGDESYASDKLTYIEIL